MKSTLSKFVVVLLVAITCNVPAYATCTRVECSFGPTIPCDQIIWDNYFQDWTCAWFKSNVTIVTSPSAYAQFTGSSSAWLLQEVYVPTGYTTHEISVQIDNNGSSNSTARLHVEVRTPSGDLLETLEIFSPTDADDLYRFNPADYSGDYVKVEFRYVPGNAPGNADFRVQYVDYFLG
ncbi:MAG TPA: hypothetical protein VHW00_25170 [Thermoanaerobaculia bacterium]|nr:hypothetical protein [Thermoanaerobaculia bacterium]